MANDQRSTEMKSVTISFFLLFQPKVVHEIFDDCAMDETDTAVCTTFGMKLPSHVSLLKF